MSIKQSVHCIQHLIHVTIFKSLVIKGKPSPTQGAEDFRLLADEGLTHPIEKKCPKALEGLGALIIFLVKDGRTVLISLCRADAQATLAWLPAGCKRRR